MVKNFTVGKKGTWLYGHEGRAQTIMWRIFLWSCKKTGIDRLSEAKKFGLGEKVLDGFIEERTGVVPNTSWKKFIGKNWYLGETLHAGIGQGYWQSSPMQLCLMTAQIANGGYKIKPRIILNDEENDKFSDLNQFIEDRKVFADDVVSLYDFISKFRYKAYLEIQKILNLLLMLCMVQPMNLGEPLMDQD